MAGFTFGSLGAPNAGGRDVFLSKFDSSGNLQWIRQLGTSGNEAEGNYFPVRVSSDPSGNVYLASDTGGNLGGQINGAADPFVAKFDSAGNLHWIEQFGFGLAGEDANGVSADGLGNIYVSGRWECYSGGPQSVMCPMDGAYAFVAKFRDDESVRPPGDFNTDGTVNASDYVVWRNGLGTTHTQTDYDVWRAHFGQTAGSGASEGSVPEPPSAVMCVIVLAALTYVRRDTGLPRCCDVWQPHRNISLAIRTRPARLGGAMFECDLLGRRCAMVDTGAEQ
jgi:hypothetical protein